MTADLHHLAAAYALDALDEPERADFEAHYPSCEICRSEVDEYRATAAQLATATARPQPQVRDRVMAEVARTSQLSPRASESVVPLAARRPRPWTATLVGAVAAAAMLLAGFVGFQLGDDGGGETRDLAALLSSPDVVVDRLVGDDGGSISVAWSDQQRRVAVVGSSLGDPGEGRVYALWLLDAGGATPSLLFQPDDDGGVEQLGELPGDPAGWGVTIEPEGGSPQPTGEILYLTET